jgi:1,4-alpha-glucan branching enzyme
MEVLEATSQSTSAEFLSPEDLYLFNEGTHHCLYEKLGAHLVEREGQPGAHFAVWAPNADRISVIGDFNGWDKEATPLRSLGPAGAWTGFVPGVTQATRYKYHVLGRGGQYRADKADPFGFTHETPPQNASLVWDLSYHWQDGDWMRQRAGSFRLDTPVSIYEVHLGSWARPSGSTTGWLSYREVAERLAEYVVRLGFTHVEFLPLMEHPFYGSWGYQTTGYFAPTSRYGRPQDLMYLIDVLHQAGLGVILDWVPSHFPSDEHGLAHFDGTPLYEHSDPRQRLHPDWNSYLFNYGRPEVRSFLASSAFFWLDRYHADGLRLDAVASMLYLDYSRKPGQWIPNQFGGRENLEAVSFLRQLNVAVYGRFGDVQTIAEESTAWPMVSRPTYLGGLGFGFKWDMGFMHDTLKYFSQDPVSRKFHHNELTFRGLYAFKENFLLPFSHDEVGLGKGSLLAKMPGDAWQKFANLRLLFGYLFAQPGKKVLFMGGEFGQWREWDHDRGLDWGLLDQPSHAGLQRWVSDLNRVYCTEPALHQGDCAATGFEWVDCSDAEQSTLSWLRRGTNHPDTVLIVCNFTADVRRNYKVGVPTGGYWRELLNSDAKEFGGSGQGNFGGAHSAPFGHHSRPYTLLLTLPPLAVLFLKTEGGEL